MQTHLYRAFTMPTGDGGNPAGVVFDAAGMSNSEMQGIATEIGFSETSFLTPVGEREYTIRYFSPKAEVDFCGHATIATAVALADNGQGACELTFQSNVGEIPVTVDERGGVFRATLNSVTPAVAALEARAELLEVLGWSATDLDQDIPAVLAFGGIWHPVLWAESRERLARLDYDFEGLAALMRGHGWGTVSLLFRENERLVHSRNAFPIGGVVEDPATGAAAVALGGVMRAQGLLPADGRFSILQGEDMGQPCLLEVDAAGSAGVRVSGRAQRIV